MPKPVIGITCYQSGVPSDRSAVNQAYIDAVVTAGGAPILLPVGLDEESLDRVFGLIDGLLLPGGEDVAPNRYGAAPHPGLGLVQEARDDLELGLADRALAEDLPILGICRGIQVLAVAAGGTLIQDLPSEYPSDVHHEVREFGRTHLAHTIAIEPGTHLAAATGLDGMGVNSFHHQSVRDVPPGFIVSATAPDGVVEAIEDASRRFTVGIQCHPEEIYDTVAPEFLNVFEAFVSASAQRCIASRPLAV